MATATDSTRLNSIDRITCPDPGDHYGQILAWAICWPWNLLWTLSVHNPFRYFGAFILREIRSTLNEIASGEFSQIESDLSDVAPDVAEARSATAACNASTAQSADPPADRQATHQSPDDSNAHLQTIDEAAFMSVSANRETVDPSEMETLVETPDWKTLLKSDQEDLRTAVPRQRNSHPSEPYGTPEARRSYKPPTQRPSFRISEQTLHQPGERRIETPHGTE